MASPGPAEIPPAGVGHDEAEQPTLSGPAAAALGVLSLPARLEAILYLKGKALSLAELATLSGLDQDEAELALITLMADYAHRDTALEIHQEGSRYSLQLRDGLGDVVSNLLPVDLSTAALRTLATIALKRRILQSDLVDLRGSGAYDHIKELLAQNFIERRRQSDGRSYWLSLSEKFHRTFAVQSLDGQTPPVLGGDQDAALDREQPGLGDHQGGGSPPGTAIAEAA
jgi:segregation and condensation protein B